MCARSFDSRSKRESTRFVCPLILTTILGNCLIYVIKSFQLQLRRILRGWIGLLALPSRKKIINQMSTLNPKIGTMKLDEV